MLPARLSSAERRIALVQILGELLPTAPWMTTAQLVRHFDADRQVIEKDLEALRNAGKLRTYREGVTERGVRLWAIAP